MDPFFPEFLWRKVPCWEVHAALWSQRFWALLLSRLGFRPLYILEHATRLLRILQQGNGSVSTTFLRLLAGLTVKLRVPEYTLFAEFASRIRFVIFDIREDANNHTTDSYSSLQGNICTFFFIFPSWTATAPEGFSFRRTFSVILCLRSCSRRGQSCLISTLDVVVAETASISCWPLSFCFPLIANSFSSFNATWSSPVFLSTLTFPFWSNQYSCFNSLISGLKIPCFDHLTFLSASRDVDQFLVRTLPMLFWVDQTLVFASYELSRILSLGTSLVDNKTWSHPVPKSWISSPCKVILNRSEESRTATGLPYTGRFLEECNTSTIKSQRSRAGMPSMRRPASKERTSDSVELWETEVRFSHIQLVWTMFDFRRHTKVSPRLI